MKTGTFHKSWAKSADHLCLTRKMVTDKTNNWYHIKTLAVLWTVFTTVTGKNLICTAKLFAESAERPPLNPHKFIFNIAQHVARVSLIICLYADIRSLITDSQFITA